MSAKRKSTKRKPKRIGRPSKLTKKVEEALITALRAGNYVDTSCAWAGISTTTFYRWLDEAELPGASKPFRDFRDAVKKAQADAEVYAVGIVRQAMPREWQAAMTFLERRYPHKWRRREAHEHTGPDGGAMRISIEEFADPDTRKVLGDLVERVGAARTGGAGGPGAGD